MEEKIISNEIKNNRKSILITILIVVLLIVITAFIINFAMSHANENTNTLLNNQIVEGLEFTNTTFENNKLEVFVKNANDNTFNLKNIDVNFYDGSGNLITSILGYIGESLDKNDIKQLVVETDLDISNAKSVTYNINK